MRKMVLFLIVILVGLGLLFLQKASAFDECDTSAIRLPCTLGNIDYTDVVLGEFHSQYEDTYFGMLFNRADVYFYDLSPSYSNGYLFFYHFPGLMRFFGCTDNTFTECAAPYGGYYSGYQATTVHSSYDFGIGVPDDIVDVFPPPPDHLINVNLDSSKGSVVSGENPPNIHCDDQVDSVCAHEYESQTDIILTAAPKAGYAFQRWELDGLDIGNNSHLHVSVLEPMDLTAVFSEGKGFRCAAYDYHITTGDECVLYVRGETGIPYAACHGDAADCFDQAQAAGYSTGSEPRMSAIIVFDRASGLPVGHVGIVTGYSEDQVSMYDSNWVDYHTIGDHTETIGSNGYSIKGYIYCTPDN